MDSPVDSIALAESDDDLRATHAVMRQLRAHLDLGDYLRQVRHQEAHDNYRVVALRQGGEVRAVAGFRICTALALGHYAYVDDLVTDAAHRSRGHGTRLLAWIADHARARGCTSLHLDSGVQRHEAHRFYLRERMDIVFYHFRKAL